MKTLALAIGSATLALALAACTPGGTSMQRAGSVMDPRHFNAVLEGVEGYFDTPPRLVFGKMPVYPIRAAMSGIPASVSLRYTIGADGKTRDIEVIGGSGKPFSTHAVIAVREWRFEPATLGGDPVPFTIEHSIDFGDGARKLGTDDETEAGD